MRLQIEDGKWFSVPSWMVPGNEDPEYLKRKERGELDGQDTDRQEIRQTEECGEGSNSSVHRLPELNSSINEGSLSRIS